MKRLALVVVAFLLVPFPLFAAQPEAPEAAADVEATHDELRTLRDGLIAAVNKGDLDAILSYCHPNVTFTSPDGRIHKNIEGVRTYLTEMTGGPDPYVKSFTIQPMVDDLTVLYGGDMGVSTGKSVDRFELKTGMTFDVNTRWSCTLVKQNDGWKIANFQSAADLFDNPLLEMAKGSLYWTGGIALAIGLAVGFVGGFIMRKGSTAKQDGVRSAP
jgi:ketosteroid isomerase-like protein